MSEVNKEIYSISEVLKATEAAASKGDDAENQDSNTNSTSEAEADNEEQKSGEAESEEQPVKVPKINKTT
jgi:hypothetical protein